MPSGRATPVFHCVPQKPIDNTPIIYASELSNGRVGLEIDLPGLASEHLNLTIREGEKMIVLRGQKPANENTGDKARDFSIKIALPESADLNDIHAKMENGVLKVDVGKREFEGTRIHIE
ncbi:UNVERIFIED_CONTAM: hypothetical protein HDU68_002737 [Siphonaria sp. JEL0065]|nr:hypothetical protein HDU68_002737 [Siphonaria sp. JEL0065]